MPAQIATSVENNFTKGLITEATGLNFPENAATDTTNCEYTLFGDVARREGIDREVNGITFNIPLLNNAIASYSWNNPGGDGNSKVLVEQIGPALYFYNIAASTAAAPLSSQYFGSLNISTFAVSGGSFNISTECTFADGNGYLFVYHSSCEPFYITYNPTTKALTANTILLQIRDFVGVTDGLGVTTRPLSLSTDHQYNLQNQGWTSGNAWSAGSTTSASPPAPGSTLTINVGVLSGPSAGQVVSFTGSTTGVLISGPLQVCSGTGTVTSYNSGTGVLVLHVISDVVTVSGYTPNSWAVVPIDTGYITTWVTDEGNYPSNADVWWYFKNSTNVFDPTVQTEVTLSTGNAPQGHYLLSAFNLDRSAVSGVAGLTPVTTMNRPTNGAWFQGRVWYTGVNGFQAATGDANFYTWTENIYFSQIVASPSDFGTCYQTDDPTSENLFSLLPTDGGVVSIVGCGTIHKLWPVANGLLVFANNGVWFITGSQGIGFSANDYTITKISAVKVLSNKSFVDVLGLPYFWNEEGIYSVVAGQNGKLGVEPLTVGTILTYYSNIPLASKKYARAAYDPINYVIQWCFKSTLETSVTDRYQFDSILNYNTYNKAFFPYTVSTGTLNQYIHGITYVSYPYISTVTPDPGFKYGASFQQTITTFADEHDTAYVDWGSLDYESYFVTGYKVHGKGIMRFQAPYINLYTRDVGFSQFYIQSVWDYGAKSFNSNKWSVPQLVEINESNTDVSFRRLRLRGRGMVMQIKVTSISGQPFDIIGWALSEVINAGV